MDRVGGPDTNYVAEVQIRVSYEPPVTASAGLYNITEDPDVLVGNSTVSTSSDSWDRVRGASALSTNWDKANDEEYEVRIWSSSSSATAYISNAKIIIEQSDAAGLTDIEMVHQYINTNTQETATSLTVQGFDNEFDDDNFLGGTFTYYFESTMYCTTGCTATADLFDGSATITNSNITTTNETPKRVRSSSALSGLPTSATDLDTRLQATTGDTTNANTSWLIIQVSNLQIPENLLLFLPLVVFIPAIFRKGFNSESLNLGVLDSVVPRRKHRRKRIYYSGFIEEIDDG
jgi:hypothetical protein